ncbi:hypothetical protein ACSBR2_036354 [Camellia fascicularis]
MYAYTNLCLFSSGLCTYYARLSFGKKKLKLQLLYCHLFGDSMLTWWSQITVKMRIQTQRSLERRDQREVIGFPMVTWNECGICLEPCTKMVLPNCCHAMNMSSESCPFCCGSIKRVKSRDLWVLTCSDDVVDTKTVSTEDLLCFYHYISSLPKDSPEAFFLIQYEYLL